MDYYDIDVFGRPVGTASAEAQLWFDRGLTWLYAYFHEEALACFQRALGADPSCAMAWWGIAYAAGPNYNMPWERRDAAMRRDTLAQAHDATRAALSLAGGASAAERAFIEALPRRFPRAEPGTLEEMRGWNADYAEATRAAHLAHPGDDDLRAVHAEALMNLRPWDLWDQRTGAATGPATLEARRVLEEAVEGSRHPGLLHLYVHLMEMSQEPEAALRAGDVLRRLVPDAGHLIHMPTHLDVQCGAYHDVLHWNERAAEADIASLERQGPISLYAGYRIHNLHFAAYGAMLLGQFEPAWRAARRIVAVVPKEALRIPSPPYADFMESYLAIWVHVLVRFGRWRRIVAEPMPEDGALYANLTAVLRYAKGVAHAALGEVEEAERERSLFAEAAARVPEGRRMHNLRCSEQLAVAAAMLDGEVAYRRGDHDEAFGRLRDAVALEDALPYDEPWGWMQPVRHALGALLLEQGRVAEAEAAYREDLGLDGALPRAQVHPSNVWALRGLMECLRARGAEATGEGRLVAQQLALAQARADGPVAVSCFCARGA